jgi:aminopeptidase
MPDEALLRRYARLAVRVGAGLQPGQPLLVGREGRAVLPDHVPFARLLVEAAYEAGASFVEVLYGDEWSLRETVLRGSPDLYRERCLAWVRWAERLAAGGAAFLSIPASDPDLFAGADGARVAAAQRAFSEAFRPIAERLAADELAWTVISAPTQAWADRVHAELPPEHRLGALWADILACARAAGPDPAAEWAAHRANLRRRRDWLNGLRIRQLRYEGPGTDLRVTLPEGRRWGGGEAVTPGGVAFVPNIPTEEVFTAPRRDGVEGTVRSTLPLNHGGARIEGIRLRFEGGRVVDCAADQGEDALRHILDTDEGSRRLGEVALVPVDSPIARRGVVFYNTLFDENASCHLALGRAYPMIEGGAPQGAGAWAAHGLNESLVHVDFMIGSAELDVTARTEAGATVPLFRAGRWAQPV